LFVELPDAFTAFCRNGRLFGAIGIMLPKFSPDQLILVLIIAALIFALFLYRQYFY
jgi:hypothetical protein